MAKIFSGKLNKNIMEGYDEEFKKFIGYLAIFAFLSLFWSGFKADMARRNTDSKMVNANVTQLVPTQTVYRQVYINNGGGPATVYYVRQ